MAEEVEGVELSEEKLELLQKAYRRPVIGVVLETIMSFEKSLEVEEAPPKEDITEENLFTELRTYGEYLRYFKAQEAEKAEEEEPVEEELVPLAEEEEEPEEEALVSVV